MMKEIEKHLGSVFKALRKKKNLTLKDVSGDSIDLPAQDHICSEQTLMRFENKGMTPSLEKLGKLTNKLGLDIQDFFDMAEGDARAKFESDFLAIKDVAHSKDYARAAEMLAELRARPYCDMDKSRQAQAILLMEGILLSDESQAIRTFYDALRRTVSPKLFDAKGEIVCDMVGECISTENEFQLVRSIAANLGWVGERDAGIALLKAMIDVLVDKGTRYDIVKGILPVTLSNICYQLIEEDMWDDVIEMADKGIDFCKQIVDFKFRGGFYSDKGQALLAIGKTESAISYFKKAMDTYDRNDNDRAKEVLKKSLLAKKICLD